MTTYEHFKDRTAQFTGDQHAATLTAFAAADKEDRNLGPVRDFRVAFAVAGRPDFDQVHASVRRFLTQEAPAAFLTAFSAAEKDDKAGGRLREFKATVRVPLLAREEAPE